MSDKEIMGCPICGKSMKVGKVIGFGALTGTTPIFWVDDTQGWRNRERLDSGFWNPKGVRAFRCKECRIIILHEKRKKS